MAYNLEQHVVDVREKVYGPNAGAHLPESLHEIGILEGQGQDLPLLG